MTDSMWENVFDILFNTEYSLPPLLFTIESFALSAPLKSNLKLLRNRIPTHRFISLLAYSGRNLDYFLNFGGEWGGQVGVHSIAITKRKRAKTKIKNPDFLNTWFVSSA